MCTQSKCTFVLLKTTPFLHAVPIIAAPVERSTTLLPGILFIPFAFLQCTSIGRSFSSAMSDPTCLATSRPGSNSDRTALCRRMLTPSRPLRWYAASPWRRRPGWVTSSDNLSTAAQPGPVRPQTAGSPPSPGRRPARLRARSDVAKSDQIVVLVRGPLVPHYNHALCFHVVQRSYLHSYHLLY